jgi:putative colanic acid biosynthesis UDP-glucose lipid carrier transferase
MGNNNQTNNLIKWLVIIGDVLVLNALLFLFASLNTKIGTWAFEKKEVFWLVSNLALVLSETRFSTIIHLRMISAADVLRRVVMLVVVQVILAYLIMKGVDLRVPVGKILIAIGLCLMTILIFLRLLARSAVKRYRQMGRNMRTVTFVGNDSELLILYDRLIANPTMGYRFLGYYADEELKCSEEHPEVKTAELRHLGTIDDLLSHLNEPEKLEIGDELYVCLSRRERNTVRSLSHFCDKHVKRFYFVPVSVETMGIDLKREFVDDMEIFTNYENPLLNPVNKFIKRSCDILFSGLFLLCALPFFPIIALIIKIQSPGPIFFKQKRTGLDGKDFYCYKFRSMHVNADADRVQATKDDPRKYAFGNFMRKANIDELPQFWNVLKGDMSIVGPRPHMLAHTEMYSELIGKYMVRHFVKPGVTGWAQVTGFRGETKELWQMEGRVKRDIWYMEHWSIWLDMRIIWLTAKSMVVHDKNAY